MLDPGVECVCLPTHVRPVLMVPTVCVVLGKFALRLSLCVPFETCLLATSRSGARLSAPLVDFYMEQLPHVLAPHCKRLRCIFLQSSWYTQAAAETVADARKTLLHSRDMRALLVANCSYVPIFQNGSWSGAVVCRANAGPFSLLHFTSRDAAPKAQSVRGVMQAALRNAWEYHHRGEYPGFELRVVHGPPWCSELDDALHMLQFFKAHCKSPTAWTASLHSANALCELARTELRHKIEVAARAQSR